MAFVFEDATPPAEQLRYVFEDIPAGAPAKKHGSLESAVDAFKGAAARMAQGVNEGLGAINEGFGLDSSMYRENADYWNRQAEETGSSGIPAKIYQGIGMAPAGVAQFVAGVPYAAAQGAAKGYQAGGMAGAVEGAALEAVKRYGTGRVFKAVESLPFSPLQRAGAFGGVMGAQTAAEGGTPEDITASAITGAALSVPTEGGQQAAIRRNLLREGVQPDTAADLAGRAPETTRFVFDDGQPVTRAQTKPPITFTDPQGRPLDIPTDPRPPESIGPLVAEINGGRVGFQTATAPGSPLKTSYESSPMPDYAPQAEDVSSTLPHSPEASSRFILETKEVGPDNISPGTEPDSAQPETSPAPRYVYDDSGPGNTAADPITRPGPGAQTSASRRETPPDIVQLRKTLDGIVKPDTPLSERINIGKELFGKYASAKGTAGEALATAKGVSEALWSAWRKPPVWTDFKATLGRYSADRQQTALNTSHFAKQINKSLSPEVQEGITNWIEAGGDRQLLEERRDATTDHKLKQGYETALNLAPDQTQLAENIRNYFESRLDHAAEAGIIDHGVQNYVNHVWKRRNPFTNKVISEVNAGLLRTKPALAKQRLWQTFFEGEQAGGMPKDKRIGFLVTKYDQALNEAIAARSFIKSLLDGTATDGRPLVAVSGSGKPVGEEDAVNSFTINPQTRPADTGDYRHINNPALKKWKWAAQDSTGVPILIQGDMVVHPEIYRHLSNVLGTSAIRDYEVAGIRPGKLLLDGMQEMKNTLLSLSLFHQVQEGVHAVGHEVNPFNAPKIDLEEPLQRSLVEHGLMVFNHNALHEFGEGSFSSGLINRLPVVGRMHRTYGEYLFGDYIPRLKMKMAVDAYGRNRKRYPDLSDDQVKEITARQANAAFGELNYQMMGRNRTMQDLFRLAALAPDFLEARGRFAAQALKPYGKEQAAALIRLSAIMAVTAQVTNLLLNKEPDWSHPFSLKINGKYYTLRSVPGDIIHLFTDPRSFTYGRVNPTFARPVIEALTGRDSFGRKRDLVEQVIDWGRAHVPIPAQGKLWKADQTAADSLLQSLGIGSTVARTRAEKKAHELILDSIPLGRRSHDDRERVRHEGEIMKALRNGDDSPLTEAVRDKLISAGEAQTMRRQAVTPPLVNSIKHLDWPKALEVWQLANSEERTGLRPAMIRKGTRYMDLRPDQAEHTREELQEIRQVAP